MDPNLSPTLPQGMVYDPDGNIQWYGVMNYFTNFHSMSTFFKIFIPVCFGFGLLMSLLAEDFNLLLIFFPIIILVSIFMVLGFYILAFLHKGKAFHLYSMDATSIHGRLIPQQANMNDKIATATIIIGALAGNLQTVASGISSKDSYYTDVDFNSISKFKVKGNGKTLLIRSGMMNHFIFGTPEQIQFIVQYLQTYVKETR